MNKLEQFELLLVVTIFAIAAACAAIPFLPKGQM